MEASDASLKNVPSPFTELAGLKTSNDTCLSHPKSRGLCKRVAPGFLLSMFVYHANGCLPNDDRQIAGSPLSG